MDVERNANTLSSASPDYDFDSQSAAEFPTWAVENAFIPSFLYSPEAQLDESPTSEYPPLKGGQSDWPVFGVLSQVSIPSTFNTFSFLADDVLVSPYSPGMDTNSDAGEFSPVNGSLVPDVDAAPTAGWSWPQPSSDSIEAKSLSSSFTTRNKDKTAPAKPKSSPTLRTSSRSTRKSARKSTRNAAQSPSEVDSSSTNRPAAPEEVRARYNHNLVEKKYRNRLNIQFERLLSVLPSDQQQQRGRGGGDGDGGGGEVKCMSKGEVLDVAMRRIKELEREKYRLQRERRELLKSMEMMNGVMSRKTSVRR